MVQNKQRTHSSFLRLINVLLLLILLIMAAGFILSRYYNIDLKDEVVNIINSFQPDEENDDGQEDASAIDSNNSGQATEVYGDWKLFQHGPDEQPDSDEPDSRDGNNEHETASGKGEEETSKDLRSSAGDDDEHLLAGRYKKKSVKSSTQDREDAEKREEPAGTAKEGRLEPQPEESSPELLDVVESFSKWMEYQHRRSGIKYIRKAYAKRQKRSCILYLKVVDGFRKQDEDWLEQTTQGIREYWAEQLQSRGKISGKKDAYVILINGDGKPIGGSRRGDPSALWWN